MHGWLLDSGVHWGFDGDQRQGLGLGDDARHTWADGLDRLFLGHALPASAGPFDGRLPAGEPEGSAALALAVNTHRYSSRGARRKSQTACRACSTTGQATSATCCSIRCTRR